MSSAEAPERPRAVGARARILVALALLGGLSGAAWGLSDEPRYAAEATVVASDPETSGNAADARLLEIAGGREVSDLAARSLGGDVAGAELLSETSFRIAEGVLFVESSSDTPDFAAATANAYAGAVVETTSRRRRGRIEDAQEQLSEELALLDPASPEAIELTSRLAGLDEQAALGPPLELGAEATLPGDPSDDRPALLWALGGALAGILAGALFAAAGGRRSGRISGAGDLGKASGLAVVATLPRLDPLLTSPVAATLAVEPAVAEELELLSDELDLGSRTGPRTLAVVSAGPGEGRSSLALGLAAATTARGGRVLLVEADLRSPGLAERLGLAATPGLAEYLAGAATPREVLQTVALADTGPGGAEPFFICVPGGDGGRRDAELLDGERFARLVERVSRVYDLIVFDTGPIGRGPDGLAVARAVETNLLCARGGGAGRRELRRAASALEGTRTLGAVLIEPGRR